MVGTFWTRLGTHTGRAESGTVEEIEKFRKTGKPVLLYFSSVPVVPDSIDIDQYEKLLEIKKRYKKEGIVFPYKSIDDLQKLLQRHITSTVNSLHEVSTEGTKEEIDEEETQREAIEMFKLQFESFLRRVEAEWNSERDSDPINIDEGKYILERTCSEVLDFRAQIVSDEESKLTEILNEATKRLKASNNTKFIWMVVYHLGHSGRKEIKSLIYLKEFLKNQIISWDNHKEFMAVSNKGLVKSSGETEC